MKLELGSGDRPTPGFISSDPNFPSSDHCREAKFVNLEDNSLDQVLALGVIEHMTYAEVGKTLDNVYRMLKSGGEFWFDVPDIKVWAEYLLDLEHSPFPEEHVLSTIYGWQRFPGDEHKSGWTADLMIPCLEKARFSVRSFTREPDLFLEAGFRRRRMDRWQTDAHWYFIAVK